MPRRTLALLSTSALVFGTGFVSAPSIDLLGAGSDNIEHVLQLEYEDRYGTGANRGSDLEFATIDVAPRGPSAGEDDTVHPGKGRGATARVAARARAAPAAGTPTRRVRRAPSRSPARTPTGCRSST
jgi:hypothetical protein